MLREVAEYPNAFVPLGPRDERIATNRFTLCMAAGSRRNTVQRQRFDAGELDDVLAEVRSLLRARGRCSTQWEVGSAAEPRGLVKLLLERGLVYDEDPLALALVLRREPPPPPNPVLARRVESFQEFAAASQVQWVAFGTPASEIAERRATLAERWAETLEGASLMHAVWIDGEIVGAGTCTRTAHGVVLFGGATVPPARGRGAYRALIHARWAEAVAWQTPVLLTQAGRMSRPILERLGFEQVGELEVLLDEF